MILRHMGRHLWRDHAAAGSSSCGHGDEVGLPSDPEFRSAFVAYLEWGHRLAVIKFAGRRNAHPGTRPCRYGVGACRADRYQG